MRRVPAWPALALLAGAAAAQGPRLTPGGPGLIRAMRTAEPPHIDGRLDDAAWAAAPVFAEFVQIYPAEGESPGERTELRVLYDDHDLYVGVTCFDRSPALIERPLGRRDSPPYSDNVTVFIDANRDRRTAAAFKLTAAGVQQDALYYDDDQVTYEWDAVWDGAAQVTPQGWSAEFAIPLRVLRYGSAEVQTWGFGVRREIARTHEVVASDFVARSARGLVSRLGDLVGIAGIRRRRNLELTPYVASRFALQPQYSDPARPRPRLTAPVEEFGFDLKWDLGTGLAFNAAVNPDFGQVEADEIIQNLTTFELQFPEKRPFFHEGLDLFQPVGSGQETVPQQLFYSRRIGLETSILSAAKLTGRVSDPLQIGLLDAFVAGAGRPRGATEDDPDPTMRLRLAEPLRLAPDSALPIAAPASVNYLAAVARWRAAAGASLGAAFTSALPFAPSCPLTQDQIDDAPVASAVPGACRVHGGNALGLDFSLRTRDSEWALYGQVDGAQIVGGPSETKLPDGTALHPGDSGFGAYVTGGKQGGAPWRFELHYEYESPWLDLNASGFQRTQNEQMARATLLYTRPSGGGPFHNWELRLMGRTRFTTDGRGIERGRTLLAGAGVTLRNFTNLSCDVGSDEPRYDVREIQQSGVPYFRNGNLFLQCWYTTNPSLPFSFDGTAFVAWFGPAGPMPPTSWVGTATTFIYRPHPRFETRLTLDIERNGYQGRWVETDEGQHLFGDLLSPLFSATLRQQVVLGRRLTLQAYLQLFTDFGRYGPFYATPVTASRAPIHPEDLTPVPAAALQQGNPDFHDSVLNLNLVLRWEYRLGSTLFLVYTRSQQELPWTQPAPTPLPAPPPGFGSLGPRALGPGPTVDTFLVKLSYWWSL